MRVMFACLADHATADSAGKLSINGIFDKIGSTAFPARHSQMFLVLRLMFEFDDSGRTHAVEIVLRDADGREYFRGRGDIASVQVGPGEFSTSNQILAFRDLVFTAPGRYEFAILANGIEVAAVPFDLLLAPG